MANPQLLTREQITSALGSLPGWSQSDKEIQKHFQVKDFAAALALVNAIGEQAETMDHHPDMLLHGWNKVRVAVSTHSAGGLTQNDMDLAKRINEIPTTGS
ncbi:MAG: 4a-hydroxytetrahydrobiopterin dehydratase [Candidatus Sumerlaeaceae bacterium]